VLHLFGEAASLGELDPIPGEVEGGLWALVHPGGNGEVVVENGGASAFTLFDGQAERLAHLFHTLPLTHAGASAAAAAERVPRLGQAEFGGEAERLVSGRDRLLIGRTDIVGLRLSGIGGD